MSSLTSSTTELTITLNLRVIVTINPTKYGSLDPHIEIISHTISEVDTLVHQLHQAETLALFLAYLNDGLKEEATLLLESLEDGHYLSSSITRQFLVDGLEILHTFYKELLNISLSLSFLRAK